MLVLHALHNIPRCKADIGEQQRGMNLGSINLACMPPDFARTKDLDFSDILHIEQIAIYADKQSTLAADRCTKHRRIWVGSRHTSGGRYAGTAMIDARRRKAAI
jgi:hypothetical protein